MKIVHLVIGGDLAGGQIVALQLARAAREAGHEVAFVSPSRGAFVDRLRDEGLRCALIDVGRSYRWVDALRLARFLRRERADVLHTHTLVAANVLSRVAGRAAGVAVVSHMHIENVWRRQRAAAWLLRTLDNLTVRLCAAVVAVSDDTKRALVEQGYPERAVRVIRNGIEIPDDGDGGNGDARRELGIPPGVPLVGCVARLAPVKGQRELIRAFAALDHTPSPWLVLVGMDQERGGAYRAELEREAATAGVGERTVFAGQRDDVPAVLAALDVFVLASFAEGLPMTVLEAMARAKPVVATPVGGVAEAVVDGETGVLVPPGDPQRLAAALRALLADEGRRGALGTAARLRVQAEFDVADVGRRFVELYAEVARGR